MTRTLANDAVEIELGTADWTIRWTRAGVSLGPCRVVADDLASAADAHRGTWRVETTRSGAAARWSAPGGTRWCELRLPTTGRVVEVQVGAAAGPDRAVHTLGFAGPVVPTPTTRLVNGYDSWSYSGVRAAAPARADTRDCFWSTTLVSAGGALAVQALSASRRATTLRLVDGALRVEAGPTPRLHQVEGTWGFETLTEPAPGWCDAGGDGVSEPVAIAAGAAADALALTEELAELVPRRPWRGPPACGWESWYHYAIAIDPATVLENARLLKARFGGRPGFDLLQVDDGWQQTYGSWVPNDRFPEDLGELVEQIHALDLRAGLWLAPFMVQPGAFGLGLEHEDWCVVDPTTGTTALDRHGRWALDASNPAVVDALDELGQQVREWGLDMVKLDFLYLGGQEGGRHDPMVTGTEALQRGLRALVDPLGDRVYVLGCGAPLLPTVGLCHASRIGHDLAVPVVAREFGQPLTEGWSGWLGITAQARQAAARWALHGRWFHNDPEIVMAWGSDGRGGADGYSLEEAHTQAVVAALVGGPFLLADALGSLLPDERAVLEDPAVLELAWDERGFRPVDLFEHPDAAPRLHAFATPSDLPSTWVAERGEGRTVTALFNWTDGPATRRAPDGSTVEVPAHGVRLTG